MHIDDDFESIMSYDECKIVKTASVKSYCDLLRNYLKSSENPPFLIVGPSGSGKRLSFLNPNSRKLSHNLFL